jgi:hypothetical protein
MSANRRYRSAAAETGCVDSVNAVADRTSAKRCLHHGTHVATASSPGMLLLTLPGPPCRRYPTNIAPAIATCTSSARGSGVRTKRHRRTDRGHPQRFSTTTTRGLASRSESRLDLLTGGALMAQATPSPAAHRLWRPKATAKRRAEPRWTSRFEYARIRATTPGVFRAMLQVPATPDP